MDAAAVLLEEERRAHSAVPRDSARRDRILLMAASDRMAIAPDLAASEAGDDHPGNHVAPDASGDAKLQIHLRKFSSS
jgi:hypothetical protein